MQVFYSCFMKYCLVLNRIKRVENRKKSLFFHFFYGIITPRDMIFNSLLLSRKGARDHKEVRKHEQV